jgi:MoaA/NifB/PqqE/SkfB family radical SAM enzyme
MGIEASSRCNLKCPLCPRITLDRAVGDMKYEDFTKLLDKLSPFLFQVRFHVLGEPTLNPRLPEMINYTHKKGIYTNFHSNGHFLSDHLIEALIDAGLDEINIAIDGMSQYTYEQYRVGGFVDTVKNGIVRFCLIKRELKSKTPRINLQYLVMSHNEHEIKDLYRFASYAGVDWVFLKTVNIMHGIHSGDKSYLPSDSRYSRYKIENGKIQLVRTHKCSRIFSELVVNWDGFISLCINDNLQLKEINGNVFKDDLKEIIFGHDFIEARRKCLNMEYDICRYCVE